MTEPKNFQLHPELETKCVKAASDSVLALVQSDSYRAALAADLLIAVAGGPASYMGIPPDRVTNDMILVEPEHLPHADGEHVNVLLLTTKPIRVDTCFVLLVLPAHEASPDLPVPVGAETPAGEPVLLVWRDQPGQVGQNTMIVLRDFERAEILRQLSIAGIKGPQFYYLTQLEGHKREPEQQ